MLMVHTGDTQLKNHPAGGKNPETGLNRRFEDALSCFDFVIDQAIEMGAKYFIHAGDVNEERNPDSITIEEFAKRVKRIQDNGMRLIMVAGNHDADSSVGSTTSISYLKHLEISNVFIADKSIEVFEFEDDNIRFHCLPYFYKSQLHLDSNEAVSEYIQREIKKFHKKYNDDFLNICVSHYTIDKMYEGMEVNEPVIPLSMYKEYDYNAFGHIHQHIDYRSFGVNGGYAGSTFRCTFGEKEEKFFTKIDFTNGIYDKVKIPNREFVEIILDTRDVDQRGLDLYCVNKLKHIDLHGKFLKIIIKCYEKFNTSSIYTYLQSIGVFHYLPIEFVKTKTKGEERLKYDPTLDDLTVVKSYLSKQKLDKKFVDASLLEAKLAIDNVAIG